MTQISSPCGCSEPPSSFAPLSGPIPIWASVNCWPLWQLLRAFQSPRLGRCPHATGWPTHSRPGGRPVDGVGRDANSPQVPVGSTHFLAPAKRVSTPGPLTSASQDPRSKSARALDKFTGHVNGDWKTRIPRAARHSRCADGDLRSLCRPSDSPEPWKESHPFRFNDRRWICGLSPLEA